MLGVSGLRAELDFVSLGTGSAMVLITLLQILFTSLLIQAPMVEHVADFVLRIQDVSSFASSAVATNPE